MRGPGARPVPQGAWPARWLATRSLRGQLITGLVTLLALACAGVGLVSYIVISHTLLNQLDYQLQAAGGRYASCIEEKHHEGPPLPQGASAVNCSKTPGLNAGTFGARVKDGVVTDQGIIGGQSHLSAADKATLTRLPPNGRYYTRDLPSLQGDYRLTAIKGLDGDVLITGLPLSPMESTLHKVEIAELTAFLAALVLAGFIGTGFVRLSLRPLRRVAATATRVTQLPLASGRRRQPRAAHPARRHPRLRGARAAQSGRGPRRHRARPAPGRIGVRADERAGRRAAAAGPAGRGPPAGPRAGGPDPAGHRRHRRRPGRVGRSPLGAGAPG
jgi:two-component system OmpR family sensor kinase